MKRLRTVMACALALSTLGLIQPGGARAQSGETTVQPATWFDVNGGSVTTPALEAGRTYRLAVGGTFKVIDPNITFQYDSAYCYDDDATMPICKGDPSPSQTGLWARYEGSSASPFYELAGGDVPAYKESHVYEILFVAGQSKPLTFSANTPDLSRSYEGSLGVALYLQPQGTTCRRMAIAETAQVGCEPGDGEPVPFGTKPKLGETITYRPPGNGETATAKGPVIPADAGSVRIDAFTDYDEQLIAIEPSKAAAEITIDACWFTSVGAWERAARKPSLYNLVARCIGAVVKVLDRCEKLKAKRGGPGICGGPEAPTARAAASGCIWVEVELEDGPGKPGLKPRCKTTADGFALTLKERGNGPSVREVLGKRPRLIIASPASGHTVTKDSRIGVLWTATRG